MTVTAKFVNFVALSVLAALTASCGEFTRQGHAPTVVVVRSLQAASGGATLLSDVETNRTSPAPCSDTSPCPTIFNDMAKVEMNLILKDPGAPGIGANPTNLNAVTINRYRVAYRRTDGRATQGVDVPYGFDSGVTFTVPADGTLTAEFEIVRSSAKLEAPLRALANSHDIISTIADVTFFGRDQAGNDISASASIGVNFGNFADVN